MKYLNILLLVVFVSVTYTGYSQTVITRTVNLDMPDVEFQLLSNGIPILENDFLYINAVPEMPNMIGRFVSDNSNLNIDIKITFIFRKYCNNDPNASESYIDAHCRGNNPVRDKITNFPTTGFQTIHVSSDWDINQLIGNSFLGGQAIITWKISGSSNEHTFTFYVRGNNPTENAIKSEIDRISNGNPWFFKKIVRQESDYRQFNNGTATAEWTNSDKCPNWGAPDGWGLVQKDPPDSEADLWNWMTNLETGYNFLMGEKHGIATGAWNRNYEEYQQYMAIYPNYSYLGTTTYTASTSVCFALNPTGTQRSFFDGVWIKSYNGNTGGDPIPGETGNYAGYYYVWQNRGDDENSPHWAVQNLNTENPPVDYVAGVCSHND